MQVVQGHQEGLQHQAHRLTLHQTTTTLVHVLEQVTTGGELLHKDYTVVLLEYTCQMHVNWLATEAFTHLQT